MDGDTESMPKSAIGEEHELGHQAESFSGNGFGTILLLLVAALGAVGQAWAADDELAELRKDAAYWVFDPDGSESSTWYNVSGIVESIKNSNPEVVEVAIEQINEWGDYTTLTVRQIKPGQATVTLTFKDEIIDENEALYDLDGSIINLEATMPREEVVEFNISPYENPFNVFKVGKKNYTKRFNKTRDVTAKDKAGWMPRGKVTIKAKSDWKIVKMRFAYWKSLYPERYQKIKLKNGYKIPSYGDGIDVFVKNKKTGTEWLMMFGR